MAQQATAAAVTLMHDWLDSDSDATDDDTASSVASPRVPAHRSGGNAAASAAGASKAKSSKPKLGIDTSCSVSPSFHVDRDLCSTQELQSEAAFYTSPAQLQSRADRPTQTAYKCDPRRGGRASERHRASQVSIDAL